MSPRYPGSLGSLFSSQGSWEYLRHVSLGPSLFPGKGVISEACLGRGIPGPPCISALGVSDLQHFGKRRDSSELSFLLEGLGYLSLLRAPCLWSHFFPGWGLSPGGGRACVGHEKVSSGGVSTWDFSGRGDCVSPMGFPGGCVCPWEGGGCVSSGYLSREGGRVSLVCWGVGSGRGVLGAIRCPHWGRVSLG